MKISNIIFSAVAFVASTSAYLVNTVYYIDPNFACTPFVEAGAAQPAGTICLYIQQPNLNVTFNAFSPYYLIQTYTWIGNATATPPVVNIFSGATKFKGVGKVDVKLDDPAQGKISGNGVVGVNLNGQNSQILSTEFQITTTSTGIARVSELNFPYAAVEALVAPVDTCGQVFQAVTYAQFGVEPAAGATGKAAKTRTVVLNNSVKFTIQCVTTQPPPVVQ